MISGIIHDPSGAVRWIDVVDPTREELDQVAREYGLHHTSVQDCLDPEHLPKYEKIGEITFIIARAYDEKCNHEADTVQELTRKVAIFIGSGFIITVHRSAQRFLTQVQEKWRGEMQFSATSIALMLSDILNGVLNSYEKPIDEAVHILEEFETKVFRSADAVAIFEDGYFLKRKASVIKRMLRLTLDLLPKIHLLYEQAAPAFQDLKESAESHYFYADELQESVHSLLNLQISLASQRTNEVMRLLTIFSAFFMPLTFIVGVYGMNFEHMPELKWKFGYIYALLLMLGVSLGILFWFRRRGWLK